MGWGVTVVRAAGGDDAVEMMNAVFLCPGARMTQAHMWLPPEGLKKESEVSPGNKQGHFATWLQPTQSVPNQARSRTWLPERYRT